MPDEPNWTVQGFPILAKSEVIRGHGAAPTRFVLCYRGGDWMAWVVWRQEVKRPHALFSGNYFREFNAAFSDLHRRCRLYGVACPTNEELMRNLAGIIEEYCDY